jgi:hypothetical protein
MYLQELLKKYKLYKLPFYILCDNINNIIQSGGMIIMTHKSKLLFVVAIIMIVIGAIALIGSIPTAMLYAASGLGSYAAVTIITVLLTLATGIIGLAAKNRNLFIIMGILCIVLQIIGTVMSNSLLAAFGLTVNPLSYFTGYVLPILYLIGAFISKQ